MHSESHSVDVDATANPTPELRLGTKGPVTEESTQPDKPYRDLLQRRRLQGKLPGRVPLLNPPRIPIARPRGRLNLQRRSASIPSSRGGPVPLPQRTVVFLRQATRSANALGLVHHDGVDVEAQVYLGFVDVTALLSFQEERRQNTISLREDLVVAEVPFEVLGVHQGVVGAGAVEGVVVAAEVYADVEDEIVAWEFASIRGIGERRGGGQLTV